MADVPGYFSDTELYYDDATPVEVRITQQATEVLFIYSGIGSPGPPGPTDNSTEASCTGPIPKAEIGGEWTRSCDGGGQAPDTTPVTNSEDWDV